MIDVPVYTPDGKASGTLAVDEAVLGTEVRPVLLKQAYVAFHANRRQGSSATRSRGRVEGSTRKLYRQKGTGRARMGAVRTNVRRGGGVAFAKSPKSWRQDLPIRMRRLANRNAILSKILDGEIKLITEFPIEAPKTRDFARLLGALSIDRSCLLALGEGEDAAWLSARNIADVTPMRVDQLNAFDVLNHRFLLAAKSTFEQYLGSLKPTTSRAGAAADGAAGKEAA